MLLGPGGPRTDRENRGAGIPERRNEHRTGDGSGAVSEHSMARTSENSGRGGRGSTSRSSTRRRRNDATASGGADARASGEADAAASKKTRAGARGEDGSGSAGGRRKRSTRKARRREPVRAREPEQPSPSTASEQAKADDGVPLLEAEDVEYSYGQLQALFGASIRVPKGGRVALLGPNGAGKTTLLGVISGLLRPQRGRVLFNGEDMTNMAPEDRAHLGVSQVPGGRAIFPSMSVADNLWLGTYPFADQTQLVKDRLEAVLAVFPPLARRLHQSAGTLSGGEQQMVALGRALMAGPELLMADELSLGLAPVITESLFKVLDQIVELGTSLLIVEQSVNVALGLADEVYFMEKGETRYLGAASDWSEHEEFARSVALGGHER